MKKLNTINKIYAAILILLVISTIAKVLIYRGWDRYYYGATISAPHSFPINVREGHFLLENGETQYINSSEVNNNGIFYWGDGDYSEPNEKERLPVKLVLAYASYRDSSFYADTIGLPVKTIEKAFKSVKTNGILVSRYQAAPDFKLDFVVGIANKGNVIVWLRGENFETVLLKHKIVPHEPVGDDTYYEKRLSKKQYFKKAFSIDSADLEAYKKGFDKDANYIDSPSQFKLRMH